MKRLPAIPSNVSVELRNYLHNLQEVVEQQRIQHTPPLERAATLRDLLESRIASLSPDVQEYIRRTPRGLIQGRMLRPTNAFMDQPGYVKPDKFFIEDKQGRRFQAFVTKDSQLYPLGSFSRCAGIRWRGKDPITDSPSLLFSQELGTPFEEKLRYQPSGILSASFYSLSPVDVVAEAKLQWRGGGHTGWQDANTASAAASGERWINLSLPVAADQEYPGGAEFRLALFCHANIAGLAEIHSISGFIRADR